MNSLSRLRLPRLFALLLALAMVAAACAPDAADDDDVDDTVEEPDVDDTEDDVDDTVDDDVDDTADEDDGDDTAATGGTILFGDEQEPTILNGFLLDGNSLVTTKVMNQVYLGAYKIHPDFTLQPDLIDGEADVTEDPFTVTYTIKEEAVWDDGTPVSADDFVFNYETIMAEENSEQITSQSGYEDITEYEIIDEKTVSFTFNEPYAPYRLLFGNILPSHLLEGEDFLTVFNTELIGSNGPFMFGDWQQGQQLRLVANENYWQDGPHIDELIMRYVPDTTTLTQQFVGAEINMYDPQPQVELVQTLSGLDDAEYEVGNGPVWEHMDFNTLVPGLDKVYVRQAIAHAIDRQTIAETLIGPINPDVEVLDNVIYVNNQPEYEPHYDQYNFDPEAAIALLEENGCERGGDGVFECEGDRLEFRFGTTGGNERRELTQQLVQAQLSEVGIQINIENDEGATFFERLNTPDNCDGICDYDIALFAWVGSPDPVGTANIFGCDRPQNWHVYCDEEATALMDQANQTVDEDERVRLFNEAGALISDGVPIIPFYQQPQLLAWTDDISGPQLNPTNQTNLWNTADWSVAR